jgi:FtsP/CotA-like multicopper oxidase with cupredoxin domain
VPAPARVAALHLSPGERVSAYVVIKQPAQWLVRESLDSNPELRYFGATGGGEPEATLAMVLTRHEAARSGFNRWSVNGTSFSTADPQPAFRVQRGARYRLKIHNTSDEIIPLHLQRHRLQLVRAAGATAAGILKDVVVIGARRQVEVDFVADGHGPALLHCTRQLHSDFGLVALLDHT